MACASYWALLAKQGDKTMLFSAGAPSLQAFHTHFSDGRFIREYERWHVENDLC